MIDRATRQVSDEGDWNAHRDGLERDPRKRAANVFKKALTTN
jgi:hypothetical protein